jgi:hypothetical protein
MMNRPIDGVVISSTRKASAFGQSVYAGVTIRARDGAEKAIGGIMVSSRLADAMKPGTEGRFFLHDVMGAQGLHGFQPTGGKTRLAFPMLAERAFALLAVINLVLVWAWMSADGELRFVPLTIGILATTLWATFRGGREAVLHDFRHESRVATARSHRQAVMGRHA